MPYSSPFPDIEIPNVALPAFVLERADALGDKPALIDGPTGRTLTFSGLARAVRQAAAGLAARGFKQGDVLALYSPNLPEYAVAFYATASLGGINTTVNPLYTASELAHQLQDAGARWLVTVPPLLEKAQEAVRASDVQEVFVFGEAEGATPFANLLGSDDAPPDVAIDPAHDLVALPYSSGTTGLPKGVMLTHRNVVANVAQSAVLEQIEKDEVLIGILPFYHIYGMTVILSTALRLGATVITMPRFDLEQFLDLHQQHQITTDYLVPPIILALAKHPVVEQYDLSALRVITSGAAPLSEDLAQACAERLGCIVKQGYGLTETSPVTHINPRDRAIKPGSVGVLAPNTACRIMDVASDGDAAEGEPGEIWIRGPQVMKGYLHSEAATADVIDEDGWFHTGDVGYVDEDGYLYVVDRVKELIKYKGYQVAPAELEAVALTHPAIADVAVIRVPDEEAGEIPKAFVVLKPDEDVTETDVMDYVAERVAPYKKIRRVEFVEEIPKTASGKILRRELIKREAG